ncbi:hypothetical protein PRIPAC_93811 [Pristionchus pacificus]|uniref:Transmembrane ion channel n=1 Tax=Pristionchus pacificus TaxID=54126 RepID=A0A2A6CI40_PRIPA|nr:hypothetical protein PRIPAC_93811 [Pristionchus pacificus]|eukprot:PDM77809.1 transmembrane ion channel [Pristionchus pacificus]
MPLAFFSLLSFFPVIACADGAIGFQIDLEESGSNFRNFFEQVNASLHSSGLERYGSTEDSIYYMENAFTMTAEGEQRIPELMDELRDSLCFFSKRIFATTGATRWMFPEFTEISVAVDGRAVHDTIATVLAMNGLSSYPAEYDRKASRHFCPRRIILARLPRDAPSIPSITAGKARSEIKKWASSSVPLAGKRATVFQLNGSTWRRLAQQNVTVKIRKTRRMRLVLLFLLVSPASSLSAGKRLRAYVNKLDLMENPFEDEDESGPALVVNMTVYSASLLKVIENEASCRWEVKASFEFWNPRHGWNASLFDGIDYIVVNQTWLPDITPCLVIEWSRKVDGSSLIRMAQNGTVSTNFNFIVTGKCPMNFAKLPHDTHTCTPCRYRTIFNVKLAPIMTLQTDTTFVMLPNVTVLRINDTQGVVTSQQV